MPRHRSAARERPRLATLARGALAALCIAAPPAACAARAAEADSARVGEAPADSASLGEAPADSVRAGEVPAESAAPALSPDSAYARPAPTAPVARAAEWETLETGLPEEVRIRPILALRYNRVDGAAVTAGGAYRTARGSAPVLFAAGTGGTSRRRTPLYEAAFEVPLGDRPSLRLGASIYRRTASEDGWIVGETENTVFAVFARTDYRDYYDAKGEGGYVAWSPGSDFSIRAGARFESQNSLPRKTDFSLTGRRRGFRPNPAIQDGHEQAYTIQLHVGPGETPPRGGAHGELTYERSGSPLRGDFEYGRLRGAVRSKIRISPRQDVRMRAIAGSTRRGVLPLQKIWHLGGIGTLRGHDYKAMDGDQFFLVNAEHYRRARKNLYAFAFLDYGAAWFGSGNLGRQRPALDGGLGLRIGQGPVALTVAKNLRDEGSKPRVGLRLGGTF